GLGGVSPKLLSWEDDWEEQGLGVNAVDVALASRSLATADMKRSLMLLDSVARRRVCVTVAAGPSPRIDERALKAVGLDCLFSNDFQYAFNILLGLGIKPEVSYIESTREESFASVQEAYEHYARMVADATGQPGGCGTESCGVEDAGRGTGDAGCETEGAGRRDGRRPCGNGSGCGIRIAGQARNDDGGETAERRLQRWLEDHLVENPHVGRPDRDGLPEKALRLDPPRKTTWAYLSWNTTMALGH
ncbi:MAG: hypothetical protein LBB46_03790, partial [Coriobacteriaceae bacterium]|nr:hypothetical protein [Coriobacteriaceae bacterium]